MVRERVFPPCHQTERPRPRVPVPRDARVTRAPRRRDSPSPFRRRRPTCTNAELTGYIATERAQLASHVELFEQQPNPRQNRVTPLSELIATPERTSSTATAAAFTTMPGASDGDSTASADCMPAAVQGLAAHPLLQPAFTEPLLPGRGDGVCSRPSTARVPPRGLQPLPRHLAYSAPGAAGRSSRRPVARRARRVGVCAQRHHDAEPRRAADGAFVLHDAPRTWCSARACAPGRLPATRLGFRDRRDRWLV